MKTTNINIPKLRFPEFSGEWETKTLINLSENGFSNGAFNDPKKVGSGYLLINVKDMYVDGTINPDNLTRVALDENEFLKNRVEFGDLFFTRSSLVKEGIAYSNVNLNRIDDLTFDGHLIRMRPNQKTTSPIYLYYCFSTNTARLQFIRRGKTTTMTTIGQEDIATVEISIPTLPEQQKIATFLTAVDEKLQALKQKKTLLEQYKKGVMQRIFNQSLNLDSQNSLNHDLSDLPDDHDFEKQENQKSGQSSESQKSRFRQLRFKDENGNEFPKWEKKKLGEVFSTIATKKYQIKSSGFNSFGKYKIVDQGQELIAGYSDKTENVFKDFPVIVFGDHTTIVKYINFEFIVGADGTKLLKNKNQDNLKYLYYNLCFNNVEQQGYKRHFTMLSEILIQLPSLQEQTRIANFLTAIDEKINHTETQIQQTQEYKKGLLQKMFV
ncbi:MAG TPA: restriction endonuclease subunit S [Prolixibacteraceae bacterium]|nr:restriction endonuclease subunit S [Prolixibacteraceae bacterium]